jgi:hypothetical protein
MMMKEVVGEVPLSVNKQAKAERSSPIISIIGDTSLQHI